ncbi:hypothetical protein DASC09_006800 [Saccharomycopsis crataegensis]|uniref:glycogenin glucosyltransferase n=1 Tax=Saccharomycopsis crataegensis TaxID=43959 RepID=A0AAV5QEH6_9ASCO|nr:hypothetical protein DASC09_006800 [Saccharomycopsis crataegensis]
MTNAYVTLLYSASYLPGALTLANSIRDTHSVAGKLVVLVPKYDSHLFSSHQLRLLTSVYDEIIEVETVSPSSPADLHNLNCLLKRPELLKTLTKLKVFSLPYSKVVYLDSDVLVCANLDHLFEQNISDGEIMASPDSGWPDIFNTGVFMVAPSPENYAALNTIVSDEATNASFDGADQGLLNEFFQSFGRFNTHGSRSWKRLPFLYNVTPSGQYQYNPAYKRFFKDIKALHFIGSSKPWYRKVAASDVEEGSSEYDELTKLWWRNFYSHYGNDKDVSALINDSDRMINSDRVKTGDYKIAKFDPVTNFSALNLEEEEPTTDAVTTEIEDEPENKIGSVNKKMTIIDHMFHEHEVTAERQFGFDSLF